MMARRLFECRLKSPLKANLDCVHGLFDEMEEEATHANRADELLLHGRLAAHEWIANLVQHADYHKRTPEVVVCLAHTSEHLYCIIEDNSTGFDLIGHLDELTPTDFDHFPERGMGLMLVKGSAASISYDRIGFNRNRLTLIFKQEKKQAVPALSRAVC